MIPWQIPAIGATLCLVVIVAITMAPAARAFRMGWFAIATVVLMLYAGTKPPQSTHLWHIEFQNGVYDIGSYCVDDKVHAEWNYDAAYELYTLKAMYRDLTITNDVGVCIDTWHNLAGVSVADTMAEWIVCNATNMAVVCYVDFVNPPHVVTNGVYHMEGVSRSIVSTNSPTPSFVTWGTSVRVSSPNGLIETITPTNPPPSHTSIRNN